ncbi:glycosyltransferase family 4 protein [Geodermatophilus sp. SYSU D00710]
MYGSDRVFLESVAAMREPVLAVVPSEGPLTKALTARGIPFEVVDFPVLRRVELRSPIAAMWFALRFLVAVPRLARWLRKRGLGLLYVSTIIAPVWIYAGRLAARRVLCHVHENESTMSRVASRVLLWPLRSVHRIIANSCATQDWIIGSTHADTKARCRVVYNGVAEPASVGAATWRARGRKRLVVVGRVSERKGQDLAIRATAELRSRGYDVGLTVIGDCFPGYEHVQTVYERLVQELHLDQYVSFEGYRDPSAYVKGADVVLVPSRGESFGLVAAEALMLGRPTVASRVGGLTEVIADGKTGRLVDVDDPIAIANAVADLLDHPEVASALGEKGRADVRTRFSATTYADRLREALQAGDGRA